MAQTKDLKDFGKYKAPKRAGELKRRALAVFAIVAVLWMIFDQVSKAMISSSMSFGESSSDIVPGVFHLTLTSNTGGAWSILSDATWVLTLFSILVCLVILLFVVLRGQYLNFAEVIGLGLVCGGGMGNCIDRIASGAVTDFINLSFMNYPVFNIADIGVVCGVVIFLIGYIVRLRKQPEVDSRPSDGKIL